MIGEDRVEPYNVVNDNGETKDPAAAQPERVQVMMARLKRLTANPANPDHFKSAKRGLRSEEW